MSRILISNIVPPEFANKFNISQAAYNFCSRLITNNCIDYIYSIIPPKQSTITIDNKDNYLYFANSINNKRFVFINHIINNIKCALKTQKHDELWFYNICPSNLICFIICRYMLRRKTYVILLDYTPCKNFLNINHYVPFLIKNSYGLIKLSDRSLINHKNELSLAGIISSIDIKPFTPLLKNKKLVFLFSGVLNDITGLPLAINVFKHLKNIDLYISGVGSFNIKEIDKYSNIHYLGYLDYKTYINLYDKIDVCLSLRNPQYKENINNFPSKIIEYFTFNKIVISTINYPELNGCKYLYSEYSENKLIQTIYNLGKLNIKELNKLRNNNNILIEKFSTKKWIEAFKYIENNK